jgi:hypothetical protein
VETKTVTETKTPTKMLVHIIPKDKNGDMEDKALCGKLWDHPVMTAKEICKACVKIAKERGWV